MSTITFSIATLTGDRTITWSDASGTVALVGSTLANWTEAVNTAAPNATVPVTSFTATNAATNVDAALVPKGSGAVLGHIPDSTSTGGNKRAAYATDFQRIRSGATQVASGTYSTIPGGRNNTASANHSFASGIGNVSSGDSSATLGANNTASGNSSFAVGSGTTASGNYSTALGQITLASGIASLALGSRSNTRGLQASISHAATMFSTAGDGQRSEFVLMASTTDATPKVMTSDLIGAGSTNQVVLPNSSCFDYEGTLVVRQNATGDARSWRFGGTIRRGANAAATALIGDVYIVEKGTDAGATPWTFDITADTTNGALAITVTGEAAHTLRWVAHVQTTEVSG